MRKLIGSFTLFAAGIGVGVFLTQPGEAQQNRIPGLRLNHVGIYAKDFDESMRFYTQTMGFKEAFTIRDQAGKPTLLTCRSRRTRLLRSRLRRRSGRWGLVTSAFGRRILARRSGRCGRVGLRWTILALGLLRPASQT